MLGDFIDLIVAMFDRMLTFFIIGGGVVLLALLWNTLTKEKNDLRFELFIISFS